MSRHKRNRDDDSADMEVQSEETDNGSSSTKRPRRPSAMMARKANKMVQATITSWAKEAQQGPPVEAQQGQDAEVEPPDVEMYVGDQQEQPHSAGKKPYDLRFSGDRIRKYCDDMTTAEPLGSDREVLIAGGPHGHPELMDRLYAETEKNAKVILWQNMLEHWEYTYMGRSMDANGQDTSSYHDIPMDLAPKNPSASLLKAPTSGVGESAWPHQPSRIKRLDLNSLSNKQRTESGNPNPLRIRRKASLQNFPSASPHESEGEATRSERELIQHVLEA